ncbi:MAG: hypothetical protein ACK4VN_00820 [Bacteroidales bacterium]
MMKTNQLLLQIIVFVLLGQIVAAQELEKKWDFSVSFGAAYHTMHPTGGIFMNNGKKVFQTALGLGFEYHISDMRYVGFLFSRHEGSYNVDDEFVMSVYPVAIVLDNYRHSWGTDYFELTYRKSFENSFSLSVGLFYFLDYTNSYGISALDQSSLQFRFGRDRARSDDLGLSLGLSYSLPLNEYVKLGIRAKTFYTLAGFETLSLSPFINCSF